MKKSQLRKLIRENIRSIMNEQGNPMCYACVDGIVTPMPQYGAGQNNCGSHPQYGPMFTDPASLNNCTPPPCYHCENGTVASGPAYLNQNLNAYFVPGTPGAGLTCYTDSGIPGFEQQSDAQASCDEGGCTLLDFQAAAQNYAGGYGPGWVQMFFTKFNNHPNGCNFLNSRLQIQQNKLNQLQSAGTNPNWQYKLQQKIGAIQTMIAQCCS